MYWADTKTSDEQMKIWLLSYAVFSMLSSQARKIDLIHMTEKYLTKWQNKCFKPPSHMFETYVLLHTLLKKSDAPQSLNFLLLFLV